MHFLILFRNRKKKKNSPSPNTVSETSGKSPGYAFPKNCFRNKRLHSGNMGDITSSEVTVEVTYNKWCHMVHLSRTAAGDRISHTAAGDKDSSRTARCEGKYMRQNLSYSCRRQRQFTNCKMWGHVHALSLMTAKPKVFLSHSIGFSEPLCFEKHLVFHGWWGETIHCSLKPATKQYNKSTNNTNCQYTSTSFTQ